MALTAYAQHHLRLIEIRNRFRNLVRNKPLLWRRHNWITAKHAHEVGREALEQIIEDQYKAVIWTRRKW